jgi:hypothetical protein
LFSFYMNAIMNTESFVLEILLFFI